MMYKFYGRNFSFTFVAQNDEEAKEIVEEKLERPLFRGEEILNIETGEVI